MWYLGGMNFFMDSDWFWIFRRKVFNWFGFDPDYTVWVVYKSIENKSEAEIMSSLLMHNFADGELLHYARQAITIVLAGRVMGKALGTTMKNPVYVVRSQTENAYYDFDSVWSTEAGATDYCESKFETAWDYYVTRVNLDEAEYE